MVEEKKQSKTEELKKLIRQFNNVKNGSFPGTLNKSQDIIDILITKGTNLIKEIDGEDSEYYKSIKDIRYVTLIDRFLHVKGVLNAFYEQEVNYVDDSLIIKPTDRKGVLINKIEKFIEEIKGYSSIDEQRLWIEMVLEFLENELPDTKKYQSIRELFKSEFISEKGKFSFSTYSLITNGIRILKELLSILSENHFEEFYIDFHPKVKEASWELFRNKHYPQAVFESVKSLNNYVKDRANITNKDLSAAMAEAFNEKNPLIKINAFKTQSDKDEQEGFKLLFMGAMKGIRNPMGHETYELDKNTALEYLGFLSLLFRKAEEGKL